MHASVLGGGLLQALDGLGELDVVAVGDERPQERCAIGFGRDLGEQLGDGFGVGRVAGLNLAGVRQAEGLEEHGLQLLDGGEVQRLLAVLGGDFPTDDGSGGFLRLIGTCREGFVQLGQERIGDGDAGLLHVGKHVE